MSIVFVGIDLAKNVFALHGVNATGAVQLGQPKLALGKLNEVVAVDTDVGLTRASSFRMTLPTGPAASVCAKQSRMTRVSRASAEPPDAGQSGAGAHSLGWREFGV